MHHHGLIGTLDLGVDGFAGKTQIPVVTWFGLHCGTSKQIDGSPTHDSRLNAARFSLDRIVLRTVREHRAAEFTVNACCEPFNCIGFGRAKMKTTRTKNVVLSFIERVVIKMGDTESSLFKVRLCVLFNLNRQMSGWTLNGIGHLG
jgi:hypothetical protein